MLLSECVYCVAVASKVTEWVEQWIYIKFYITLEHSSMETIWMIQKAAAMGNWWLAASSWQHTRSCITYHVLGRVFSETSNPPGDSAPHIPDLVPCDFWLFPKLKVPLKGKRFQTISEIQENMMEQLMVTGRTVWGPRVPNLKGLRCHRPMYGVSCILSLLQ